MTAPLDLADRIEQCMSCRADIVWATTDNGKPMPLNAEKSPSGNVAVHKSGGVLYARVAPRTKAAAMRAAGVPMYLSHHVDCPDADNWRTPGRKETR